MCISSEMSASEFLFISNIPNQVSPLTLMSDISNSFAKMAYFDSPDFKGNRQAFVFYPESDANKWTKVVEKLNSKENIKARFVWYPASETEYAYNVPEGVEVLPYIYVENLPKEMDFHHVVYGLPHIVNLRFMDVTYKDDKWAFIYLGPNLDPQLRRNVVMGLRSKSFNGYPVYASELMVTETAEFPSKVPLEIMATKAEVMDDTEPQVGASFRSEFLYIYNVPQPLGHGKILHYIKSMGIKFARVFFIETSDHLKRGFLHLPALSEEKWDEILTCLRSNFFQVPGLPENCGERISIEEVWFQPHGAAAPLPKPEGEFILTDYYFVYNIPRGVSEQLLVHGCGLNRIRVQLFDPTPPEAGQTRIGFAVKLASAPDRTAVEEALSSIRRKRFGDSIVHVDRIWRFRTPDTNKNERLAPIALPPSASGLAYDESNGDEAMENRVEIASRVKSPVDYLTKANLFFVHGLPSTFMDAELFSGVAVTRSAGMASPDAEKRCCFIQPTYTDRHSSCCVLATVYLRIAESRVGAEINEVFKEDGRVTSNAPEGLARSCFLHISNLPLDMNEETLLDKVPHVEEIHFLLPNVISDRSAVVLLSSSVDEEVQAAIVAISGKMLRGRRPIVSRLWLSSVENPPLYPSYRAPCQASAADEQVEDEKERQVKPDEALGDGATRAEDMDTAGSYPAAGGDHPDGAVETNGKATIVHESIDLFSIVVEGLPLLVNDSSIVNILRPCNLSRWEEGFCVITSPAGQNNRLIMYASSQDHAQTLLGAVIPQLKKAFRHRALLSHVRSVHDSDELVPVPEDVAFRLGSTQLLLYSLPRQTAPSVRTKLRELVNNPAVSIDLKCVGKKFLGHGIISAKDWQTCSGIYRSLQGIKIGNYEIKAKFLAK